MIIDSKYTKSFQSNGLTDAKYKEIYTFAVELRDFKNLVSLDVANNLFFCMEMSKFEFVSYLTNKYKENYTFWTFYKI